MSAPLVLRLSMPPSDNKRVVPTVNRKTGKPYLRSSDEDREWKAAAVASIRRQLPAGFVRFTRTVVLHLEQVADTLSSDVANRRKTLEDALAAAGVMVNDRQVGELRIRGADFTAPGEEESVTIVVRLADPVVFAERNQRLEEAEKRAAKLGPQREAKRLAKAMKPKARKVSPKLKRYLEAARISANVRREK